MIEPVYVLENGQNVSYIPIEIKNHREAYAATLHVLFKHVADFHTCVVQTFSRKYGIPEDEIMQTIQESEEFKNMNVDPVLHLGYLSPNPVSAPQQEPVPVPELVQVPEPVPELVQVPEQEPVATKRIVKKKSPANPAPEPAKPTPEPANPTPEPVQVPEQEPVAKKRIVKKKSPANPTPEPANPTPEPANPAPEPANPVSEPNPSTMIEKKKVIRKKVPPPTTALDRNDVPNPSTHNTSDVIVQLIATEPLIADKKIIRKKP